jgi:hypothetical protein
MDEDIEAAKFGDAAIDGTLAGLLIGDIQSNWHRVSAALFGDRRDLRKSPCGHRDPSALARQCKCYRAPNAAATPRYEGNFARKPV